MKTGKVRQSKAYHLLKKESSDYNVNEKLNQSKFANIPMDRPKTFNILVDYFGGK